MKHRPSRTLLSGRGEGVRPSDLARSRADFFRESNGFPLSGRASRSKLGAASAELLNFPEDYLSDHQKPAGDDASKSEGEGKPAGDKVGDGSAAAASENDGS